ncbi:MULTISPECIES: hypothetical protein [unclassified Mycobacterium]|uniref:hypothetical protein n=1 Tax=unclassified Mycobacterium TaxID=2642494 RepID=UPI0029C94443|nr:MULTISPECIES: hypothetical protein [unclassified Mycobacterium]
MFNTSNLRVPAGRNRWRAGAVLATGAGLFASSLLATPTAAWATPTGGSSVDSVVQQLEAEGYTVRLNGVSKPSPRCTVTSVHGLNDSNVDAAGRLIDPAQFTVAYVDVTCPSDHNG